METFGWIIFGVVVLGAIVFATWANVHEKKTWKKERAALEDLHITAN